MSPQALLMLMIWPVVTGILFSRLPLQKAIVWTILGGYLVLPPLAVIPLPLGPGLDKAAIPALSAWLFTLASKDKAALDPPPRLVGVIGFLLLCAVLSPLLTGLTNRDALVDEVSVRPGVTLTGSMMDALMVFPQLLPFWLAYRYLSNPEGAKVLVKAFVSALLTYSVLMILEVRLSPQMNVWVYGYFQHDFVQTMRYGGYRPIVFLEHPLWVAFITLTALVCAIATTRVKRNRKWYGISGYLGMMLLMCKSAGVILQFGLALPFLWFARPRRMVALAALLGTLVCAYPVLRAQPWMPIEKIVDTTLQADQDRGQSLAFRLRNETMLLERAKERPYFGWGGWGRALLLDADGTRYLTIPDGAWIVILGARGLLGFIAQFGLMLVPLFMLWRSWPKGGPMQISHEQMNLAAVALIIGLNMVDLIPNATLTPNTWMMAGLVAGSAARMRQGGYFSDGGQPAQKILSKKAGLTPVI
ncbi:O-antigen ligase family protein [Paracoccus aminophilus]|uniref:O-antigen ligase-related domain-containing protein n=1 Tax=Paracoccus aminophilus JCM 7686 TaxID=1367847 RepID=S5Y352_PARAH|nr:O-antigen ligase family protein [Paracoccus aminophilus]AGT10175.1 hypothetical protein JCM7686_3139 [Paracoccus aminophilus JCM 7686]